MVYEILNPRHLDLNLQKATTQSIYEIDTLIRHENTRLGLL